MSDHDRRLRKIAAGTVLGQARSGRGVHRVYGIETRCSLGDDRNLLQSQVTETPDEARAIAAEWKQDALSRGFVDFDEP